MAAREVQRLVQRMVLTSSVFQTGVAHGGQRQRWRCITYVVRHCRGYCSHNQVPTMPPPGSLSTVIHGEVTVVHQRGLPVITVPLPSRRERCRFTLRPITNTVGDFMQELRNEDKGIDRLGIRTTEGLRIASSTSVESLMQDDFQLIINDMVYHVTPPPAEKLSPEEQQRMSDVRNLVNALYEALNIDEHQLRKERDLCAQLETLKVELQPLEEKKKELEHHAVRRTQMLSWMGLGLMATQFGILARLTWWEYSWDIMEPVTYFVTYGTTMMAYAYFVLTKQEYLLNDARDRQFLIVFHKRAKKIGLDVKRYNELKDSIAQIEKDILRLRDPLYLHILQAGSNPTKALPLKPKDSVS